MENRDPVMHHCNHYDDGHYVDMNHRKYGSEGIRSTTAPLAIPGTFCRAPALHQPGFATRAACRTPNSAP